MSSDPVFTTATAARTGRPARVRLAILLTAALTLPAAADPPWPPPLSNPVPGPDDLLLPLPCGGAMAFRPIPTPGRERGYAVTGPFEQPDGTPYLLLGKYEVSRLQAEALEAAAAGQPCPTPQPSWQVPVTLDWWEALALADRYALWLTAQAETLPACDAGSGPCLPRVDGVPAYVRLPTAAEWEYAARGGLAVTPAEFSAPRYPMPAGLAAHAWSAANAQGRPQPIGTRAANPLGLHDLYGNAAEWVLDRGNADAIPTGAALALGGHAASPPADLGADRRWVLAPAGAADSAIGVRLLLTVPLYTTPEKVRAAARRPVPAAGLPAPPPPVVFRGGLRVSTNIPAQVLLDGQPIGETAPGAPLERDDLAIGERRLEVRAASYDPEEQTLRVRTARQITLDLTLNPAGTRATAPLLAEARAALNRDDQPAAERALSAAAALAPERVADFARDQAALCREIEGRARARGEGEKAGLAQAEAVRWEKKAAGEAPGTVPAAATPPVPAVAPPVPETVAEVPRRPIVTAPRQGPVGSIADEMVEVPGGTFEMGCSAGDTACEGDEKPLHRVSIRPFRIGRYEVTQGQWQSVLGSNPSRFKGDDRPVEIMAGNDVQQFLDKLNAGRPSGAKPYRLPTEAEWEYAARAGTDSPYWWGKDIGRGNANCYSCGSQWDNKEAAPVGSFKANAFGLYDTVGNVLEWVQDCWHDNYQGAPTDGSDWNDSCRDARRVVRGGSWNNNPRNARVSYRYGFDQEYRYGWRGVRLAQDL